MNIKEYISDMSVLCGAERYVMAEGKGKGVELIRLFNGRLQLFLKADKCLDLYRVDYRGENASFITKNRLTSPNFTHTHAIRFINSFEGGFLYTCGPDNIGTPVGDSIQHGMFSNLPAENIAVQKGEEEGKFFVKVSGDIYYTALFGSKLRLHREVKLYYGEDEIHLCDTLINEAFVEDQYMILYHFNIGYPFSGEGTKITVPSTNIEGVTDLAEEHRDKWNTLEKAVPGKEEECYIHTLGDGDHCVKAERGSRSVEFCFNGKNLPYMTQWKTEASGDYGLGLEPATTDMKHKQFTPIASGESKEFSFVIKFKS